MRQPISHILKPTFIWKVAVSMILILGLNIVGFSMFNKKREVKMELKNENGYFTNHSYNY